MSLNKLTVKPKWIRRFARPFSLLLGSFWLLSSLGSIFANLTGGGIAEYLAIALMILSPISIILAWKNEQLGGMALIAFGLMFSFFALFSSDHNKLIATLVTGAPYTFLGLVFIKLHNKRDADNNPASL